MAIFHLVVFRRDGLKYGSKKIKFRANYFSRVTPMEINILPTFLGSKSTQFGE
jgi:hypothetical protein